MPNTIPIPSGATIGDTSPVDSNTPTQLQTQAIPIPADATIGQAKPEQGFFGGAWQEVKDTAKGLAETPKLFAHPQDTGSDDQIEHIIANAGVASQTGQLGEAASRTALAAYRVGKAFLGALADGKAARDESRNNGENWAGQTLATLEKYPVIGDLVKEWEDETMRQAAANGGKIPAVVLPAGTAGKTAVRAATFGAGSGELGIAEKVPALAKADAVINNAAKTAVKAPIKAVAAVAKPVAKAADKAEEMLNASKPVGPMDEGIPIGTFTRPRKQSDALLNRAKVLGDALEEEPVIPRYAYRTRSIGEDGISSKTGSHAQATMSDPEAQKYVFGRSDIQRADQEVVRVDLHQLPRDSYEFMARNGDQPDWVKFKKDVPESAVQVATQDANGAWKFPDMIEESTNPLPTSKKLANNLKMVDVNANNYYKATVKAIQDAGAGTVTLDSSVLTAKANELLKDLPNKLTSGVGDIQGLDLAHNILKKFTDKKAVTWDEARALKSELGAITNSGQVTVGGGALKQFGKTLNDEMFKALKRAGHDELASEFAAVSSHYNVVQDAMRKPVIQKLVEGDLNEVWDSVVKKKSLQDVQDVKDALAPNKKFDSVKVQAVKQEALQAFERSVWDNLIRSATDDNGVLNGKKLKHNWNGMGDATTEKLWKSSPYGHEVKEGLYPMMKQFVELASKAEDYNIWDSLKHINHKYGRVGGATGVAVEVPLAMAGHGFALPTAGGTMYIGWKLLTNPKVLGRTNMYLRNSIAIAKSGVAKAALVEGKAAQVTKPVADLIKQNRKLAAAIVQETKAIEKEQEKDDE